MDIFLFAYTAVLDAVQTNQPMSCYITFLHLPAQVVGHKFSRATRKYITIIIIIIKKMVGGNC